MLSSLFEDVPNLKVLSFHKKKIIPYLLVHSRSVVQALGSDGKLHQNIFRNFKIDYINSFSPDIIHFEFSGVALSYLNHIDKLKGKKIVSCRGTAEKVKLLIYDERKEQFGKLLNVVDAVHCVSNDIKSAILPYCSNDKKIFINYPSIDTTFFEGGYKREVVENPIILSVGRFTFQKGYVIGLLAIQLLKNKGFSFQWFIVGSGPMIEEITFYIHELGLNEHVKLLGVKRKEEIKALMGGSSIFFLPSVYEGIANVVLEAMSMELPVVSTRCGGMEEVIVHGENGLLANTYDHISLAENLAELLTNCELRRRLGKTARKTVVQKFNLDEQIDEFEKVYNQLIKRTSYDNSTYSKSQ